MPRLTAVARILLITLIGLSSTHAWAAPRDRAANDKIEEAINKYYLATEFDKAESILSGTVEACEDRCSPSVKARAFMYIGIVRGSGQQDISGAQQAFQQAMALDPKVTLDDALATPAVKDAFAAAAAALGQAPATTSEGDSAETTLPGDVEGDMECTPAVREVETRRAIPVACTTDEPASKVQLRYKVFGGETWVTVQMKRKGEYWTGEIPCSDTGISGKLRWFVRAMDSGGDAVDNFGTKKTPVEINLLNSSDEEPPKYPGQPAPPRCMDAAACPEDMIGTPACPGTGGSGRGSKGWGAPCDTSTECEQGLLCLQGDTGRTCESAPSCEGDSDCPADHLCKAGTCDIGEESDGPSGPFKKNLVGVHFGADLVWMSGIDVCSLSSQESNGYSCFFGGPEPRQQFTSGVPPNGGGEISGGLALGTMRAMVSYERAFTPNIGAEVRLGFAFNGGPTPSNGAAFLPIHGEVRGKYWFGRNALGKKGIRPYVALGGGVAQVDAKLPVTVTPCIDENVSSCTADQADTANQPTLDAYKKLGLIFLGGGGGVAYAITPEHSVGLNLTMMFLFPTSGFVIQPSLGYTMGL